MKALHSDAKKKGFLSDTFVSNTLVSVYGKCGSVVDAVNMFIKSPEHDVVSWTAMLSAYMEQGKRREVLQLFRQMQEEGVCPNEQTFLIALPACGTVTQREVAMVEERHLIQATYLQICQALHADLRMRGFTSDVFISNTLISVYGKCGSIAEAENIFIELTNRDVVSWNAMLTAYVEQGQGDRALLLYRQMQHENEEISSNQQSFLITLHACSSLAEKEEAISGGEIKQNTYLEIGQALHADSRKKELASDAFISNTLVNMYGKSGRLMEAKQVFNGLSQATVISWTAILSACAEQHQGEEALQLYRQMQREGICPDQQAVMMGLQACLSLVETEEAKEEEGCRTHLVPLKIGQALHTDAKRKGFDRDIFVGSFLIKLHGKCGNIEDAERVFDCLCERSSVSWNTMLLVYVEQNQREKALKLLRQMQDEGMALDDYSITCALEACRTILIIEICKQLHFSVVAAGHEHFSMLGTALIRAYGRCAFMVDSQAVFDGLSQRDTGSWAACIAGYAQEGNAVACFHMYDEMLLAGCTPDGFTFFSLLSVCGRAGLVEKGFQLFESMSRVPDFNPNWRHYVAIIGLLGHAGEFKRLEYILSRMSVQANWELWMSVLGACRIYCNVELGKQAFDHAVVLKPNDAAAYFLMFNIYTDAGMYECAADIQKRFKDIG